MIVILLIKICYCELHYVRTGRLTGIETVTN